jgi:hypothetical protein
MSAAWRGSMIHSQFHTDSRLLESPLNLRHCLPYGKDRCAGSDREKNAVQRLTDLQRRPGDVEI